jgi:hypothetical protein
MKDRRVRSALFLALCAVICLSAGSLNVQAQNNPAQPEITEDANLETQLFLIVGTNQSVDDSKMPASLDPVVKQLRATLPFKNYRLAATLINRVKNEGRLDLSWIGGPLALKLELGSPPAPSFNQFKVRQVKLARATQGHYMVQMAGFSFGARIPIQVGGALAATGAVPAFNYENTGLATDISMRESEPVIVGTLNVGPSGDAIILVVSAKRTER